MSPHSTGKSLFLGSFIHSKSLDKLEYLHNSAVCVDENGVIVAIEEDYDLEKAEETLFPKLAWSTGDVTVKTAKPGQFFFPGFVGK
jgi:guanine deaminase